MKNLEIDSVNNETSWKKDQVSIKDVLTKLNNHFGSSPNSTGLEYLKQYDIEIEKINQNLYKSSSLKLARIRIDAENWMKNIYQNKWMHAEDYLTKNINYTTYIYTL
jgi:hypothetical protein